MVVLRDGGDVLAAGHMNTLFGSEAKRFSSNVCLD